MSTKKNIEIQTRTIELECSHLVMHAHDAYRFLFCTSTVSRQIKQNLRP